MPRSPLVIRRTTYDHPDVARLVAEVQEEYRRRYGSPDAVPLDEAMFTEGLGGFFVGYEVTDGSADGPGEAVAMGGWRTRDDVSRLDSRRAAELKRMYVVPGARGRGHARAMLAHVEADAAAHDRDVLVLETGTAQPEAITLYLACGYEPVVPYGYYADEPDCRCYARRLLTAT